MGDIIYIPPTEDTAITPDAYQEAALDTAVFPGQGTFWGLQYASAGLSNEAGEVLGVVKKMQRDGGYTPDTTDILPVHREALLGELGDVAWYLAVAASQASLSLSEVFDHNLSKLASRAARGTLQGSGDHR